MRFLLLTLTSLALASCADLTTAEHKPVPPSGSDPNYQPWNIPQQGEGGGQLGGLLEGR